MRVRSFEEVCAEQTRSVAQAVENALAEAQRARTEYAARGRELRELEEALGAAVASLRDLDAPEATLKHEAGQLESRLDDIRRQLEAKRQQLRELQAQSDDRRAEVQKRRADLNLAKSRQEQARALAEAAEATAEEANGRTREAKVAALAQYARETFEGIQKGLAEATALESYQATRASFEKARLSDSEVMALHEERIELERLVRGAQIPSVQQMLEQRLEAVRAALESRFPGLLSAPPSPDDIPMETFVWYDPAEDLTYLLLPVPASCWHSPPSTPKDPRGQPLCRVLFAFVQAVAEPVPSIELERDLLVLEIPGDHLERVSDLMIEVALRGGGKMHFLPTLLSSDLQGALT